MPGAGQVLTLLGGGGLGAVIVALINKLRTREERQEVQAKTAKTLAEGEAAVLTSVASAFTEVTGGLREEIERLQGEAGDIRDRAGLLETELRIAMQRVVDLERQLEDKAAICERLQADLDRVRGERDAAVEKTIQQEGEIRQLKSVIDAHARAAQ